jgi:hypothetical protein
MSVAWSFSSLKSFEQCPRKYYHTRVAKDVKESETEAMLYGTLVHEAAEKFIRDDEPVPEKFAFMRAPLEQLKAIPGEKHCEMKMGLTEDLEPCDFFAKNVWWRGIADLVIVNKEKGLAYSVDYKTGKNARYADTSQLDLVATAIFKYFPEVQRVKSGLLFVVSNEFLKAEHEANGIEEYLKKPKQMLARLDIAMENNVWNAINGPLCRFCAVKQCEYNRS